MGKSTEGPNAEKSSVEGKSSKQDEPSRSSSHEATESNSNKEDEQSNEPKAGIGDYFVRGDISALSLHVVRESLKLTVDSRESSNMPAAWNAFCMPWHVQVPSSLERPYHS